MYISYILYNLLSILKPYLYSITDFLGEDLKVQVEGETSEGHNCRVWVQVLNRNDGLYIAR